MSTSTLETGRVYYIQHPGQPEQAVGRTTLTTITEATIRVVSCDGGRAMREINALVLAYASNAAMEAGASREAFRQAAELGEEIGKQIKANPTRRSADRVIYRSADVPRPV